MYPAPAVGDEVVLYSNEECPDGPESHVEGAQALHVVMTVTPACTDAAVRSAINYAHISAFGSGPGVGLVDVSGCDLTLHAPIELRSNVLLWGGGTATWTAASDMPPTCVRPCMIYGYAPASAGVVGLGLESAGYGQPYGIRLWGGTRDLLFHDLDTAGVIGVNIGENVPPDVRGTIWDYGMTPLWPVVDDADTTVSCSTFVGWGEDTATGWSCDGSAPLGLAVGLHDSANGWALLNNRGVCGAGLNIHGRHGEIAGHYSEQNARDKFPGAQDIEVHDSTFVDATGLGGRATSVALVLSDPFTSSIGAIYRYPERIALYDNTWKVATSNDIPLTTWGGTDVYWGDHTYLPPQHKTGFDALIYVDTAWPTSGWVLACDGGATSNTCTNNGQRLLLGGSSFPFTVETP